MKSLLVIISLIAVLNANSCDSIRDDSSCDSMEDCTWCECSAVPSACYTLETARTLPSSVFTCHKLFGLSAPSGMYTGSQNLLGIKLDGSINVSGSTMEIKMVSTGLLAINMDCPGEGFSLSGTKVNLSGINSSSNCVRKVLNDNDLELVSFTYSNDQFTFLISKSIL